MNKLTALCLTSSVVAGLLFFMIYNQYIIIAFARTTPIAITTNSKINKKEITLYYVNHEKWNTEKLELLWSENTVHNTQQLINAWLTVLEQEHIIHKKITFQSILLSSSGVLYISFDQYPLEKKDTLYKKWMFIEALLKTLCENNITAHAIQFLVQHEPLQDCHIDFSQPWPIQGFLR